MTTALSGLAAHLHSLAPHDRARAMRAYLRDRIGDALGIEPSEIGSRERLMDLGVSSLKAVELKIEVERELNVSLSSSLLFDYPTIEALAGFLIGRMDAS
jgi:myxalamid-type polyketide synthase MxaB